ncbi:PKD domain-containing protein [Salibacteraceae bacterium]|nr:PKD domain-containing protein [Salibacteraceae bacterium]
MTRVIGVALCMFVAMGTCFQTQAQSITNAGTDFWFGFTEPEDGFTTILSPPDPSIVFQTNISSRFATSGFLEVPGSGFLQTFSVTPGSVTKIVIPDSLAWIFTSDSLESKAIHVHTNKDCVVYANTYHAFRSEASLVLPNRALGSEYYAMTAYPVMFNRNYQAQVYPGPWRSEFLIVAPGETVTVEITPTGNTRGGHLANVPFSVTLDSGELYQVQGDSLEDLTGSRIVCTDPTKTVAVFAGNVWSQIYCGATADPLYEAMFPVASWGREYILIPTPDVGTDMYRVLAEEDDTEVYKDGVLMTTIDAGEFYQDTHMVARLISSNNRISVGQFMVSNGGSSCSNISQGDPSTVMINPNEQMFLDSITFFAVSEVAISLNHVVIVTRTTDTSTLELDGSTVIGFEPLSADSSYAFTSVLIDTGSHNLFSTGCGFIAYSIGLGNAESYSYAAGVRLTDLNGGVDFSNISANSDTICQFDSIQFNVNAIGNPYLYEWKLGDGALSGAAAPIHSYDSGGTYFIEVIITSLCRIDTVYDTITVVPNPTVDLGIDTVICLQDTFQLDADSLAISYLWGGGETSRFITIDSTDTYIVTVFNTRCAGSDSIHVEFRPTVNGLAIGVLDSTDTVCDGEPMRFTGITSRSVVDWMWSFGDGDTDTAQVSEHSYVSGGNYTVELEATYLCGQDSITDLFSETVKITQTPSVELGADTFACTDVVQIRPQENDDFGYDYRWFFGGEELEKGYELTVTEEGIYRLFVNNDGCTTEDSIQVFFSTEFVIPNVFTPNSDGVNDYFRIQVTPECHDFDEMSVYNRWGTLVFFTQRPLFEAWNGYNQAGEKLSPGMYFYQLSGPDGSFRGTVSLLSE